MLLQIEGVSQRFGQQLALREVNLSLAAGEVRALVGENGAGKSTLIKLLTGVYPLQEGEIRLEGRPLAIGGPADALAAGIRVIHQERQLVPSFTVVENIYLGQPYPKRGLAVDRRAMRARCAQVLGELGLAMDLHRTVGELSPPEAVLVELARVLLTPCRLLILDEPTAALSERECAMLFRVIRNLQARGTAVLYVSHRLEEVLQLADTITVLRAGQAVATVRAGDIDRDTLIGLMTDELPPESGSSRPKRGALCLQVTHLATRDGRVRDAALALHAGEILGVFGLGGSGRTELLEAIAGLRAVSRGSVQLRGQIVTGLAPRRLQARGLALIPEDRLGQALVPQLSVEDNMLLATLPRYARLGWISRRRAQAAAEEMLSRLRVKGERRQMVTELSGGNQQKVVFAGALLAEPDIWLCDEPTQAVDVATRAELHRLLRAQAEDGKAVLFVSSDLQEMLTLCHRLVVLSGGRTTDILENDQLSAETVLAACFREEDTCGQTRCGS